MKKDDSVSISGSGNGNSNIIIPGAAVIILLFSLFCGSVYLYSAHDLENHTIEEIYLKFHDRIEVAKVTRYQHLLFFKKGDLFNYQQLRKSMENLYKVGSFANIEIRVEKKPGKKLGVYFIISEKYTVQSIKMRQVQKTSTLTQIMPLTIFKKKEVKNAIFSLREGVYFEEEKLADAVKEVKNFLNSRGYFNPAVTYEVIKDHRRLTAVVKFLIMTGPPAEIKQINLNITPRKLQEEIRLYFSMNPSYNPYSTNNHPIYIPARFNQTIEKIKRLLKQKSYYFPEITVKEDFLDSTRSSLNLNIKIKAGYRYVFKFEGIGEKMNLIASIWEKKVFEKWAEQESRARILYYLKNRGYFDARVESKVEQKDNVKTITFHVKKKRKYTLGKIYFQGNQSIPREELLNLIEIDDLVFDRYFHLRLDQLWLDQEILRLYYISRGFSFVRVTTEPKFRSSRADVYFKIEEGKRFTVDTLLFEGNRFFNSQALASMIETRANGPFVQQKLSKDLEKITRIYQAYGFDHVEITAEVSPGTEKSVLIRVKEGKAYQMGNLIIIGASFHQRKLIEKLFPLKTNAPFDRFKIDTFRNNIENSSIFNQFKIVKINRDPDIVDVLIKVNPDRSVYYGFGIGYEDRKGFRGTLEYQERNVLKSYSTFSAMVQVGEFEKRGLLSFDTPYFFKTPINASLKLWWDNEIYPSYKFDRYGVGETLVKRLNPYSYLVASLSWYRTTLTDLEITPRGVDQLKTPFDTTALNLSYVREKRDDPFNPTQGSFFSSDLKIGLPVFEKDYSFIKLRWSFQKNFKILKNATFAASVRNGLATGDMSITERFFAGGIKTFRGTHRDQLSPLDPETRNPKGGNALILFNFETTFPLQIFPISDLYYSIFADIGNVFETVKDINFGELQSAIGFSLKYKTRMGPLRLDVAWNVETGKPKFHIGIGNVF